LLNIVGASGGFDTKRRFAKAAKSELEAILSYLSTDGMVGHRRCVRKSVHKREDSDAASKMKLIEAASQNHKTALSQHPQRAASRRLN